MPQKSANQMKAFNIPMMLNHSPRSIQGILFILISGCMIWGCSPLKKAEKQFAKGYYQKTIEALNATGFDKLEGEKKAIYNGIMAESYRRSNRTAEAFPYLENAKHLADSLSFYYAQSLKANQKYDDARKAFDAYVKSGKNAGLKSIARREIKFIDTIDSLSKVSTNYHITNLDSINTAADEYGFVQLTDKMYYFTSNRRKSGIYHASGNGYDEIFSYEKYNGNTWEGFAEPISGEVNVEGIHNACASLNARKSVMVFARSGNGRSNNENKEVDLFISYNNGGNWSEPKPLSINKPGAWDSSPMLTPDGKTLFFASNRDGGAGGIDIYKATRNSEGDFSNVKNLGRTINTPGNELFPYLAEDKTLYFASDGHPGFGGLDLFKAEKDSNSISVSNLGIPFNTHKDDFGLTLSGENKGYFISARDSGAAKGGDDVYAFEYVKPRRDVYYYLTGTTFEKQDSTSPALAGATVYLMDIGNNILDSTISDSQGKFRLSYKLKIGEEYIIEGLKDGYISHTSHYSTAGKGIDSTMLDKEETEVLLSTSLSLTPNIFKELETTGEIVLEHILYDLNDHKIRPDAAKELDKLIEYMNSQPSLRVELGSHTDVRGGHKYNMELSQRRADAAVEYIISKGISSERLSAKGYGETKPRVENATTEDEHQMNRRTTVMVIDENGNPLHQSK